MTPSQAKKLEGLQKKLDLVKERISPLEKQRIELEKKIQEILQAEYMLIIRENGCSPEQLRSDLGLAKIIHENGITESDIKALGGIEID